MGIFQSNILKGGIFAKCLVRINLMRVKLHKLLIALTATASVQSAMANNDQDLPRTKTSWDGEIVPVHVFADPSNVKTIQPTFDTSKETALFSQYLNELNVQYKPISDFDIYLPQDIARTRLHRVKVGFETKAELRDKDDKISIYLSQNKQALNLIGLYKQRMLAWNEGRVGWITIKEAVRNEGRFPVLNMLITPESLTEAKLKYFENKFGLLQLNALQQWSRTTESGTEMTIAEAIASTLVKQKINLGY